jgi:hypothetical protein
LGLIKAPFANEGRIFQMDLKEIIRRRITLKEQHIYLIRREMEALKSDLQSMERDPAFIPNTQGAEQQGGATMGGK